jgi:hypothetical protein
MPEISSRNGIGATRKGGSACKYPALLVFLLTVTPAFSKTVPATDNFWRLVAPIAWTSAGFAWIYCLVWVFIEGWAKLRVYRHLKLNAKRRRKFLERVQERCTRDEKL